MSRKRKRKRRKRRKLSPLYRLIRKPLDWKGKSRWNYVWWDLEGNSARNSKRKGMPRVVCKYGPTVRGRLVNYKETVAGFQEADMADIVRTDIVREIADVWITSCVQMVRVAGCVKGPLQIPQWWFLSFPLHAFGRGVRPKLPLKMI